MDKQDLKKSTVELPYKLSRILIHLSLGVILFWGEKKQMLLTCLSYV